MRRMPGMTRGAGRSPILISFNQRTGGTSGRALAANHRRGVGIALVSLEFPPLQPRFRLSPLALTAAMLSLAAARTHAAGVAFIINSNGSSISVIDMTTRQEVRRIPALREPHHIALSPDGKSLLVGDTAANLMLFLDPATGAVQRRVPVADLITWRSARTGSSWWSTASRAIRSMYTTRPR